MLDRNFELDQNRKRDRQDRAEGEVLSGLPYTLSEWPWHFVAFFSI